MINYWLDVGKVNIVFQMGIYEDFKVKHKPKSPVLLNI